MGLTQAYLAQKTGLSQSTISRILSGENQSVQERTVDIIARALGIQSSVLMNPESQSMSPSQEKTKLNLNKRPKRQSNFKIFLACPSDVTEEAFIVKEVIEELNLGNHEFKLELINWTTHAYPGFGEDPQSVINEAINDEYDIFLGIMWARFGTPTNHYGSGTEEEFRRAYERWKDSPESIALMLYFKDAPISPSKLDINQLTEVKQFKQSLSEEGLYWTFQANDEFAKYLRLHLPRQAKAIREKKKKSGSSNSRDKEALISELKFSEEEGLIDLMDKGLESFQRCAETMGRMVSQIELLGQRISSRTDETIALQKTNKDMDIKLMRKIADLVADDMNDFSSRMEAEIPIFSQSYSIGFDSISQIVNQTIDSNSEGFFSLNDLKESTKEINSNFGVVLDQVIFFRNAIASTPGLTTTMNRAKKRTIEIVDQTKNEFEKFQRMSTQINKTIEEYQSN
jgi:transcriptional regulator with XRE-family HTH domain